MLVAKKDSTSYLDNNQNPEKPKRMKKKNKYNRKNRVGIKLKVFIYAIVMLIFCLSILLRYAQITGIRYEISEIDTNISKLERKKQNLIVKLDEIKESDWIEKEAKEKLEMVYPTENQVVYLDINNNSSEVAKAEDNGKPRDNDDFIFLKSFKGWLDKIMNIF
ncbi:septum formation initiator family protein [Dethiothermospora halolimnae]|uniref:septum formation initiator family protein n=1 Tax=Dethiothermospora halolimnae TaxID=3114390 RepID=UPI003CCBE12D